MPIWFVRIFTLVCAVLWVGFLAYTLWQKLRIRRKSEKLEMEAELGRSTSQIFHDISGHVASLSGYFYLLESKYRKNNISEQDMEKINEFMGFLVKYTKNMKGVLGDVYQNRQEPVSLREIVTNITHNQVDVCFKHMEIKLSVNLPDEEIYVSPSLFEALFNITRNACQAMEQSEEPSLDVNAVKKENRIVITVSDTGMGIREKDLKQIFKYGYSTKPGGTGQGMAIAKQAVERAGGKIEIKSEPGRGTTVIIETPVMEAPKNRD